MKKNRMTFVILVCSSFLISNNIQAATVIGFDNVISGSASYGFDSNGDSSNDIVFLTNPPNPLLDESSYPNVQGFYNTGFSGGGVLGVSNGPLRVNFTNGISNSFGFAFHGSVMNVQIFDATNNELTLSLLNSPYNYVRLNYVFSGVASYALIKGNDFVIDEFDGTYSSNDLPELQRGYVIPIPAAVWLFGSGLLGLFGIRKKT